MKITTKGRYAIHILYDLAVNGTEHPVSVKEMATRQEISVKYTEQIISILNKAGYVSSSRGFQGGYRLTKQKCATIMLWEKVDKAIRDVVDHVTLQDLLDWQKQERC